MKQTLELDAKDIKRVIAKEFLQIKLKQWRGLLWRLEEAKELALSKNWKNAMNGSQW